jgi:hypothetical protein
MAPGVAAVQAMHEPGEIPRPSFEEQVVNAPHQAVGQTLNVVFAAEPVEQPEEALAVVVVHEQRLVGNGSGNDVEDPVRQAAPRLSRHFDRS